MTTWIPKVGDRMWKLAKLIGKAKRLAHVVAVFEPAPGDWVALVRRWHPRRGWDYFALSKLEFDSFWTRNRSEAPP